MEERLKELAGHSVQEASIVYQRRFQNTPYLYKEVFKIIFIPTIKT